MYLTTTGIVLREVNYKEADKILTVLTGELGKKTVQARACRRKNSKLTAGAQLLVYSEMTLHERNDRYTLHELSVKSQFLGLQRDVTLLSLGSYFAQLLEVVAQEGTPHPELLRLLLNSLYALDTLEKPQALVKAAFELALMCRAGYAPMLENCAVCGAEEPKGPSLHLREGVLHCAACRAQLGEGISMPLNAAALAALRHVAWGEEKKMFSFQLEGEGAQRFYDLAEAFLLTQLERGFATLDFYKQLQAIEQR